MGKITLIDDFNENTSIIYANDQIDAIYDIVVTLFKNKYRSMDSQKIVEERIADTELYKVLSEIEQTLKYEPDMF